MDQYLSVVYYFIVWIFFLNDGIEEKMITFIPSHFYCFSSFLSKFCSLYKWHTIESKQVEKEKKIGVIWQFFFFWVKYFDFTNEDTDWFVLKT